VEFLELNGLVYSPKSGKKGELVEGTKFPDFTAAFDLGGVCILGLVVGRLIFSVTEGFVVQLNGQVKLVRKGYIQPGNTLIISNPQSNYYIQAGFYQ
jgi:hypothetical protein